MNLCTKEFTMINTINRLALSLLLLGLTACPVTQNTANNIANDNIVNVTIDQALLEAIRGKVGQDAVTPSPAPLLSNPSPDLEIAKEPEMAQQITQAIKDNADALNKQDRKLYAAGFHPDSVFIPEVNSIFDFLLETKTNYFILEADIERMSVNRAAVYVNREVTNIYGTVEQDILYTMRRSDNDWKIYFMTDQTF